MKSKSPEDERPYSEQEVARRRDATIKAMIATPPKPRKDNPPQAIKKKKRAKAKA
jgi:hypothetical protein